MRPKGGAYQSETKNPAPIAAMHFTLLDFVRIFNTLFFYFILFAIFFKLLIRAKRSLPPLRVFNHRLWIGFAEFHICG